MSGAEDALERAVLSLLATDAGVRAALGDPLRISEAGEGRPAYPCLEMLRHVSEPRDAAEAEASEHRLDLRILARPGGREAVKAALAAARDAVRSGSPAMEGWRCILLTPAFSDLTWSRSSNLYQGHLRVRAIVERV